MENRTRFKIVTAKEMGLDAERSQFYADLINARFTSFIYALESRLASVEPSEIPKAVRELTLALLTIGGIDQTSKSDTLSKNI